MKGRGILGRLALAAAFGVRALGASAETLDDLLEETRNASALEEQAHAAREQEFLASRDRQQELLEQARAARDAEQARSQQISAIFDANELELNDLETLLKAREGNLGELFGVTRQVAADLSSVVYNSLISVQYPGRDAFFLGLAKAKALPSSADLERLWFEILREMTETGRVTRFQAEVVTAQGAKEQAEVVRIGGFIAMSDGRYLAFNPGVNTLTVLPRQPARELRNLALAACLVKLKRVPEARLIFEQLAKSPREGVAQMAQKGLQALPAKDAAPKP